MLSGQHEAFVTADFGFRFMGFLGFHTLALLAVTRIGFEMQGVIGKVHCALSGAERKKHAS